MLEENKTFTTSHQHEKEEVKKKPRYLVDCICVLVRLLFFFFFFDASTYFLIFFIYLRFRRPTNIPESQYPHQLLVTRVSYKTKGTCPPMVELKTDRLR
jgi:hypothetical protein